MLARSLAFAAAATIGCSADRPEPSPRSPSALARPTPVARSTDERPPAPWPGPRGFFTFIEAENLTLSGEGIGAIDTPPRAKGRYMGSRGRALDASAAGDGVARAMLRAPKAGRYELWLRTRARTSDTRGVRNDALTMDVQQGHTTRRLVFDDQTVLPKDVSMTFIWQRASLDLSAGDLWLTLGKAVPQHTGLRIVDCLLLTADAEYEPNARDFQPQVYARLRVPTTASTSMTVASALTTARVRREPLFPLVAPGQSSTWINITRMLDDDAETVLALRAEPRSAGSSCTLEVAARPAEEPVESIEIATSNEPSHVVVPHDLAHRAARSGAQIAAERARLVRTFEPVAFGRRPSQFPILVNLRGGPDSQRAEREVLEYVGVNGIAGPLKASDIEQGFVFGRVYNSAFHVGSEGYANADWARMRADLQADARSYHADPHWPRYAHLKLIDEAQASPLRLMVQRPETQRNFKAWLSQRRPDWPNPGALADATLVAERDSDRPELYYLSQRFRAHQVAKFFRDATQLAHQVYPPGAKTTQNLSDGAVMFANMYAQGNDYFEYFRTGALDVALSEDWTNEGASRQLTGFNVALLRAATKYRKQPIHMYVIAYSGRRPFEVKLKALSNIAQGARLLELFSYSPSYLGGEPGWADEPPIIAAAAELTREIGAVEDILMSAWPVRSDLALIYSIPSDIWSVGHDITHGNERMLTYLALRHAQRSPDVLSDDDVREGSLNSYRVAYLHGEALGERAASRIAAWVRAGGVLVLSANAATRDELNRPTARLDRELSLTRRGLRSTGVSTQPSGRLGALTADVDRVVLPDGRVIGVPLLRHAFGTARGQTVLARFADGEAAAISQPVGRGQVVAFGFLAATAYVREALRLIDSDGAPRRMPRALARAMRRPAKDTPEGDLSMDVEPSRIWGRLPTAFDASVRDLLTQPASAAVQPVKASDPLVEATLLEGPNGLVVPLANYSARPIDQVTIRVRPSRPATGWRGARGGPFEADHEADGSTTLRLPLESTDFIAAEWTAPSSAR